MPRCVAEEVPVVVEATPAAVGGRFDCLRRGRAILQGLSLRLLLRLRAILLIVVRVEGGLMMIFNLNGCRSPVFPSLGSLAPPVGEPLSLLKMGEPGLYTSRAYP